MPNSIKTYPITPCLWCNDNALEKAQFYCSVFIDSRIISQHLVVVVFELNGTKFQALNGGVDFDYNESISWSISCQNQEEVDYYWEKLIQGGGKEMDCAWLQDKFGMRWQVVPTRLGELMMDPDKTKASKVMQAMRKMQKIVIKDLEAAYNS